MTKEPLQQQTAPQQPLSEMTLAEFGTDILRSIIVTDLLLVLGIACIGIVAWQIFSRYISFKWGGSDK